MSLGWRVVEKWGADLYGDPCRECGFGWKLSPAQAVASVRAVRGAQRAEDVARNNADDAHHHLWDINRTLGPVKAPMLAPCT